MRPAPPLSLHCSGRGAWRQLRVALLALAAAVPAGWAALHLEATGPVALLAAAIAAAVAIGAGLRAIRPEPVLLAWDGSHWNVDGQPAALDLMLDLGAGLLLRLRPASGGRALWLAVT
ncbi:MAG: hypothetical protein Q8L92_06290, partial [Rubrivivax sp.]|nr:hypothetical protein [Rubrivivax sp.]